MVSCISSIVPKSFVESNKKDILDNKYIHWSSVCGYKFTEKDFEGLSDFGDPNNSSQVLLDLRNRLDLLLCQLFFHHLIDKSKDIVGLYIYVRNPYKLLWFSLVCDYLSEEDFANYIEDCWISEENPNQDVNISRKQSLDWFKRANKNYLMNDDDYKHWSDLGDTVKVYRGVSVGREEYGLSWTDDLEKAKWFMNRFNRDNKSGYLLEAEVPKNLIIAYFNTRGEAECLLDVFKAKRQGLIHKVSM